MTDSAQPVVAKDVITKSSTMKMPMMILAIILIILALVLAYFLGVWMTNRSANNNLTPTPTAEPTNTPKPTATLAPTSAPISNSTVTFDKTYTTKSGRVSFKYDNSLTVTENIDPATSDPTSPDYLAITTIQAPDYLISFIESDSILGTDAVTAATSLQVGNKTYEAYIYAPSDDPSVYSVSAWVKNTPYALEVFYGNTNPEASFSQPISLTDLQKIHDLLATVTFK